MTHVTGKVRNGKIEILAPSGLSEGDEVRVWLEPNSLDQDDERMNDNEIRRTLEAMDKVEPFVLTDEERLAWQKAREDQKAFEIADFERRAGKLLSHWE